MSLFTDTQKEEVSNSNNGQPLLGLNDSGKPNNWSVVPTGTKFVMMFLGAVQIPTGFMGAPFAIGHGLYLPNDLQSIEEIASRAVEVTFPLTSVLTNAINDGKVEVGKVYEIEVLGKVNTEGKPVKYQNFNISLITDDAITQATRDAWHKPNELNDVYRLQTEPHPSSGNNLTEVFKNGVSLLNKHTPAQGQPVAQPAPQQPVAQPAPQQPVAQPAPQQPAPQQPAPALNVGQPAQEQPTQGQGKPAPILNVTV